MISVLDIPHLRAYKQKVNLPKDPKTPSLYSVIFMNTKDVDGSIALMNHPKFITGFKYNVYYIDPIYREKIYSKRVNVNYKTLRNDIYDRIKDETDKQTTQTPISFEMIRNRNLYFDMSYYNSIFFKYMGKVSIRKKINLYFDYINSVITNNRFSSYKYKGLYIDVSSWTTGTDTINNPVMYMYIAFRKYFEDFAKLGNIDIILYTDTFTLRVNPSLCKDKDFSMFRRELTKLTKSIPDTDEKLDTEIAKQEIKDDITADINEKHNFTGDVTDDEVIIDEDPDDDISSEIKDVVNNVDVDMSTDDNMTDQITSDIDSDEEAILKVHEAIKRKRVGKSSVSLQRDKELREKQRNLTLKGKAISDIVKPKTSDISIPTKDVSTKVTTTNENVKTVKFTNFEKTYNDNLMKKDLINIVQNLNNASIPAYVKKIDVKDTSDELNYKETYHIVLEDENRVQHSLTFDVPKFIEDKFLYLNGNKKIIMKQLFMKPIVKTGPDEVQICSNYNKIFIRRYGQKLTVKVERLRKALAQSILGLTIIYGDASTINNEYKTTVEYDEISRSIISLKTSKIEMLFNQADIYNRLGDKKLKSDEMCIGFYPNKTPIIMNMTTEKIGDLDLIDFIIANCGDKLKDAYDASSAGTSKYVFTKATIMGKDVPVVLLLGYCEGLTTVMNKANIKYEFTDKRPNVDNDTKHYVQFEDGYLVFDRYPIENSLLLNGLDQIPTRAYKIEDFDEKDVYIDLFGQLFKARNLANAFETFYQFMIDPITKEVLEDLDYPTDFVSVVLFANALLADNSHIRENDMSLYRVRSNEIVNALLHKQIAKAYSVYRDTSANKHPVKMSIPKDAIIKELLKVNTVEEFSILNPIYESEKLRSISVRGVNGMNLDKAFTQDKRAYDASMKGIIGISTSPDYSVGVTRKMSVEPNIIGPRGYIDMKDDKDLKDVNIFTAAEMLTPLSASHDDSTRTAMASKQSSHIIPVKNSSPVLISNGMEQVIQYNLSKDFVIIAEDDGTVDDVDSKTGIYMVKYKNGNVQAIDTHPRVVKNSSSGFYISNKLNCDLNVGDKFKKNDIIAYEDKFFRNDKVNGNRFNIGSLEKIAVMSAYSTYEDSAFITKKMSNDMTSDIVMMKDVTIGVNSNVDYIVKIGDPIQVGDLLIRFDNSYDDENMNKFLQNIGDDLKEEIQSLGKVPIKSKYSGVIEDIRIYCTVDLEDLSPSLKKIVSEHYSRINKKKAIINKYDKTPGVYKAGILLNEASGKISPTMDGKIKGREVFDGVLIEFYIKYNDPLAVGDKIAFYAALKSVIGEVIPEGYEPYSVFRPDEEISTFLGPSAILKRMTPSVFLVMFTNKVLVELKRKLQNIYEN